MVKSTLSETVYDKNAKFYLEFVDRGLADGAGLLNVMLSAFHRLLGDRLDDARVCDIACGEGYLSRYLARLGAREVVGIDLSTVLIDEARRRGDSPVLKFQVGDAQDLQAFPDASFDVAVSQMALMDIKHHRLVFESVRRILVPGGLFAFSILHPCFEVPFRAPQESQFLFDSGGTPIAHVVRNYLREGFWQSGGDGVRGHMGAYHRTLSTYANDLIESNFRVKRIEEPVVGNEGLGSVVPRVLMVLASAE